MLLLGYPIPKLDLAVLDLNVVEREMEGGGFFCCLPFFLWDQVEKLYVCSFWGAFFI
jgi:hypothetical protein